MSCDNLYLFKPADQRCITF